MFSHLFKPLLDVCVCLQFELSACVGPVHEEKPLLGVHLFHQDGRFLIVPHLRKRNPLNISTRARNLRLSLPCNTEAACIFDQINIKNSNLFLR